MLVPAGSIWSPRMNEEAGVNEKAGMNEQAGNDKAANENTASQKAVNEQTGRTGKIRHYADERIDVSYDATRCIHAGVCVHRLPAVFDTGRRPWILPSGAGADAIAAVVARCPTGALHATRLDGGPAEETPAENTIVPMPNGPLYVRGQLHLRSPEIDVTIDDLRMALCRCGQSRNKPFCDNSHRDAGFRDPGTIAGATATAAAADGVGAEGAEGIEGTEVHNPLSIVASTNGPLALEGAFTLRTRDGSAQHVAIKATLCRCGASGRKPFCDGSHRRIGFISAPAPRVDENLPQPQRSEA
jgi:CDGSH-type Zn-finger protein/uncharacterized Fe-S cluster protein YjdI